MPQIPREFVREVVDRTSIVSLVGQHVRLRRRGGAHVGLCPFHHEKTPSFQVNEERKNYHCFGCNASGDAISWMTEVEGLGFVDAVQELAGRVGMRLPEVEQTPEEREASRRRELMERATDLACRFFEERLAHPQAGAVARDYLAGRGYSMDFARAWRVGFAPDSWDELARVLARERIPDAVAVDAGLLKQSERGQRAYDFFRNRLMFPIVAAGKKVVAFGGRTLGDDKAKYINTPETPIYRKAATLFGLHEQRAAIHKEDRVLVVEGYFDVLGLNKAGLEFAVAPCGTALTDRQLASVRRHTQNLVLLFDSDEAGRRASLRALELCLEQDLWPQRLAVPDGKDPDDYVKVHGAEAARALLEGARPLLDHYVESIADDVRARRLSPDAALADLAPLLARLGLRNARHSHYVQVVHGALAVEQRVIVEAVERAGRKLASEPRRAQVELPTRPPAAAAQPIPRAVDDDGFPPPGDADAPPVEAPPRPPPEPPPTQEQLTLLRLLVQDLAYVGGLVEECDVIAWIAQPSVARVLERFLAARAAGRTPTQTDLLFGPLHPQVVRAVAAALASTESWHREDLVESATQECILRLRRDHVAGRYRDAKRELDALQRRGDRQAALLLGQATMELQREREALDAHLRAH